MALIENTAAFFADFGIAAIVDGVPLRGIFDNAHMEALGFTAGTAPTLLIVSSEAPGVAEGDAVSVAGTSYTVSGAPEPDGTGFTLLRLEAV